jgi:hypothetical protein
MKRLAIAFLFVSSLALADENPAPACYRELAEQARFAPISKKLPLADITNISFENLANKAVPTEKERKLLGEWVEAHKPCFQQGLEFANKNWLPQIAALAVEVDNNLTVIVASLFNKEISYGTANKKIQALADDLRNRVTGVVEQMKRENALTEAANTQVQNQREAQETARQESEKRFYEQRQAEAELRMQQQQAQEESERRQRAMQILGNFKPYQAPAPYQMQIRPNVTTNCMQLGNQWTCNSR